MRAAAPQVAVIATLFATPSLGGPGDRIDRFPIQLTGTIRRYDQDPVLAMEESGRFVAAWKSHSRSGGVSTGPSLMFRRFAADGAPLGGDVTVLSLENVVGIEPPRHRRGRRWQLRHRLENLPRRTRDDARPPLRATQRRE
jgi:hypothetical protein